MNGAACEPTRRRRAKGAKLIQEKLVSSHPHGRALPGTQQIRSALFALLYVHSYRPAGIQKRDVPPSELCSSLLRNCTSDAIPHPTDALFNCLSLYKLEGDEDADYILSDQRVCAAFVDIRAETSNLRAPRRSDHELGGHHLYRSLSHLWNLGS